MNSVSLSFIALFSVILSFNFASCQYGYNSNNNGVVVPTYSKTTAYQQQPFGQQPYGQQTTYVQETVQQPNGAKTVVTKTVSQPAATQPIVNYGYGRKRRSAEQNFSNNPANPSSQTASFSNKKKRQIPQRFLRN